MAEVKAKPQAADPMKARIYLNGTVATEVHPEYSGFVVAHAEACPSWRKESLTKCGCFPLAVQKMDTSGEKFFRHKGECSARCTCDYGKRVLEYLMDNGYYRDDFTA